MTGTYGLGVDLGTTYTAAAIWRDGRAEAVPLGTRAHTVPSVLFLREDGVLLVGEAAVRRGATEPERVAREFKRRFGDGIPLFLGDREFAAEELAGQLLRWVTDTVAEREGGPPSHVTLTHPATWGRHRLDLLVTAAEQGGLPDVGLLAEPVAAAAYHASTDRLAEGRVLAVYDLGGGTFDATVVRKTPTGFAVQGEPGGDDGLGGVDFDQAVLDHVAATLGPAWRALDLEDDATLAALAGVRAQAVEAKEALSLDVEASVPVILPGIVRDIRITRGEFESAIRIPLLRSIDLLAQVLEGAGVADAEVQAVLLVGGSSRIPLVSRLIATQLGIPVALDAHPKYAICLGAAIATGARLAPVPPVPTPPVPTPPVPTPPPTALRRPARPAPPRPAPSTHVPVAHPTAGSRTRPAPVVRPGTRPTVRPVARPAPAAPTGSIPPAAPTGSIPPAAPPPAAGPPPVAAGTDAPAGIEVDLRGTGITEAVDTAVATAPAVPSWAPSVTARDEPVVITHVGDRRRGRRAAVVTASVGLLVVLAITAAALLLRPATAGAPTPPVSGITAVVTPPVVTAGTAALTDQPVPPVAGDRMHAATAVSDGAVAVGSSDVDGVPRAWRSSGTGPWEPAEIVGQATTLVGAMNGVVRRPGRRGELVAVGWTAPRPLSGTGAPTGAARQPAVWTSPDGRAWTLRTAGDLGIGLGELSDVVVGPAGDLLATASVWSADPRAGDGAVLRSTDGRTWEPLAVTGLDGPGPSAVRRLLVDGGRLVAVGARVQASATKPAVWTSPDGVAWSEVTLLEHMGPGSAEATGLLRLPDGPMLAVGFTIALDGSAVPAVWSGPTPEGLRPFAVDAAGTVDGVAVLPAGVSAVGSRIVDGSANAAAWTVALTG